MTNSNPDKDSPMDDESNKPREETLAERSARLEAEAASMAAQDAAAHYEEHADSDPLAPTPHPEDEEGEEDLIGADQAKAIVGALQNELDAAKDQLARALAEAENTRRRAQKDREDAGKFAISGFAKDILEISDTLRRALESAPEDLLETEPRFKNFVEGVEATERVLLKSFEKNGIEKIEPMDEPFNPNFHEVMFEAPVPGKPAGIVMQVLEAGYILNDRLLRAAKVGVTKEDPSAPASGSTHSGGNVDTEA